MDIDYGIAGLVLLGVIILIVFLIRRNNKDKHDFEKQMNESEIKPGQHNEGKQ
jgi:hypothetical protein